MDTKDVSLVISKDLVQPIINAKVQEAVLAALGGSDLVLQRALDSVINQRVDDNGKPSSYSSNKTWIEWAVNERIQNAMREEMKNAIDLHAQQIKEHIAKHLSTKKGQSAIADALVDSLKRTFASTWNSTFTVNFTKERS